MMLEPRNSAPSKPPPAPANLVWLIARRELLDHLLSLKFHVCVVAMALLLGLSAFVMYRDYRLRMEIFATLRERARPRPGESGLMAVVEPRPLSVFAKGLDETLDRGYTVTAYDGIQPHESQTPVASIFALFAPPDLLYIVKALLSLIALLFAYDTVSGEKESGTLKLVLSSSIARGELAAGKMLGGLAAVLLPFLALLLGTLLALVTRPALVFGAEEFSRLAIMFLATLFYIAAFFSLGTLVSALSRTSASALIILLFLWAAAVFALPSAGDLIAEHISPPPSAETQELLRHQAFVKNRFIARHSEGNDRQGSFADFNRDYDRLVEDYRAKLDAMIATSQAICRVSPAATLTYIFTDLAGTGLGEQRRLGRALMDFKSRNMEALTHEDMIHVPNFTSFQFSPPRLGEVFQRGVLTDFAILALTCGALCFAAVMAFLKVDPR
jgi:ABC-type transport system involved in multi-copper enzyme maturation permease subunit